ncbi:MAG: dTDP-glucose 4,6-dehydratase [Akkermansiaceae bacterium]|jgi:dTDP-glucose 4,6-dehydratase|nr:dTDP-glucose 4,6-dehydratase [Akkermansiaceae bacterium]
MHDAPGTMKILVTGGAGFIGSTLVRQLLAMGHEVLNVDLLTYAGHSASIAELATEPRHHFLQADIADRSRMREILGDFRPDALLHLAAESHVDRSIDAPDDFIRTNLIGTFSLLEAARALGRQAPRFVHVSTDEVFGSLGPDGHFTENSRYDPHSPYSATKAASDHLVAAWGNTYGLPVIVTRSSNNYGPYQFPEKLIPLVILKALHHQEIPVFGHGLQVRDWIHVDDHGRALIAIMENGQPGSSYNIGAANERTNIEVVREICALLDLRQPRRDGQPHHTGIVHVADRPGHDSRYAIDPTHLTRSLGWAPQRPWHEGLATTVDWYLAREDWWKPLLHHGDPLRRRGAPTTTTGETLA